MKTSIIFTETSTSPYFKIDTKLGIQPAVDTVMDFQDVDNIPEPIRHKTWIVSKTRISFMGDVESNTDELGYRLFVELRLKIEPYY